MSDPKPSGDAQPWPSADADTRGQVAGDRAAAPVPPPSPDLTAAEEAGQVAYGEDLTDAGGATGASSSSG